MNTLDKYEAALDMKFKLTISELHWKQGLSILELSKRTGVSRDWIYKTAERLNLTLKTAKQSAKDKYLHHTHWATGLTKETSAIHRRQSLRMKKKNSIKFNGAAEKRANTIQNLFRNKLWPQEIKFKRILDKHKVKYELQRPIGSYNIDFFIPALSLCVEIDSTSKWGIERRNASLKKDTFLKSKGLNILRIDKRKLSDLSYIDHILKTYNVI